MDSEDNLLKHHRRVPLCNPEALPCRIDYGLSDIKCILPHREPFLLVEYLTGIDLENRIISGEYHLSPELPLFQGHFPDYPVYPGTLQVEAIGQTGLCLVHFMENNATSIGHDATPPNIRATRIKGVYFRSEVKPGDTMTLLARVVEYDAYFGTLLGQVLVSGKVATAALLEVTVLD